MATLWILAAAVLWGTTGTAQALGPDAAPALAVGAARLVVGGVGFLVLAAIRRDAPWRYRWPPLATVCACAGIALYQLTFFGAVRASGVALGTVVAIGSAPLWAGVLAWSVRRERPGRRWWLATALTIAGVTVATLAAATMATVEGAAAGLDRGGAGARVAGVGLALAAGASYATYALAIKVLIAHRPPDACVTVAFAGGAVLVAPLLLVPGAGALLDGSGLVMVAHLGLITVTAAYACFGRGLVGLPVATVATLSLAEPLTAALLGWGALGERITAMQGIGFAAVALGVGILATGAAAERRLRSAERPRSG